MIIDKGHEEAWRMVYITLYDEAMTMTESAVCCLQAASTISMWRTAYNYNMTYFTFSRLVLTECRWSSLVVVI